MQFPGGIALFFFLMVLVQEALPQTIERQLREQRRALRALEQEVKKRREELRNAEVQERGLLNTISLLGQNLSSTREYLQKLTINEQALVASLEQLSGELDSLQSAMDKHRQRMAVRVRELHMRGHAPKWEELLRLFQSEAPPQRLILYMDRLLRSDRQQVQRTRELVQATDLRKRKMQIRRDELMGLRKTKSNEEKGLASKIHDQEQTLNSVQTNKEAQKKALAEFERNQRTMQSMIQKLEERRRKQEADRKRRKLPPAPRTLPPADVAKCHPLQGPVISSYGLHQHAVLRTTTRNLGIEIRGKAGAPVRAAAQGKVALVSRIEGRGQSIILEHGGAQYTVYGHLRQVFVREGQEIKRCQEIGQVGDDESLDGVKLYFQVNQGVQTMNPLQWLGGAK